MRTHRALALICLGLAGVLGQPAYALGHTPTAGVDQEYDEDHRQLEWVFVSESIATWPTYASNAAKEALNSDGVGSSDWSDPDLNRSLMPDFDNASGGAGSLRWSDEALSPCTGNPTWIACAPMHAANALNWKIFVRDFSNDQPGSHGSATWHWWEHPSATGTLFLLERAVLHEAMHVAADVGGHDSQSTLYTIMQDSSPSYNNTGWNTQSILVCDEAAAFLEYDVRDALVGYPDCFDHITNHGVDGLKSKVTFASSDTVQCLGLGVTFSGVLSVGADVKNYKLLSSNPLGSRTVLLQRSSPGSGTWSTYRTLTTNSITGAYATSVGFSTSTTWDWRVTYAGEVAIDPRTGATIRVTWTTGC